MRTVVVLLALVLALAPASAADEPPPKSYAEAIAAFPEASSSRAFAWRGVVEAKDVHVGTFSLKAEAVSEGQWQLEERLSTTFADARVTREADLRVDPRLVPLRGALTETDESGDTLTHTWKATVEGYRVETRSPVRTPMERQAQKEEPSLCGLVSLALFARLVAPEPATYATKAFHPDWNYLEAERPFVPASLTVSRVEAGDGGARLRLHCAEGEEEILIVLDAASRDLIEIRIRGRGPVLRLRPADMPASEPTPVDALFAEPSKTPRGCAARAALAFAMVDIDHFDRLIHWPTLRHNMRASIRGSLTDEAFRERILGQFREQGRGREPQAREEAEAFIRTQADDFDVQTREEDGAVVTLSPAWGGMRLTLKRVDGGWRLVRLPGA